MRFTSVSVLLFVGSAAASKVGHAADRARTTLIRREERDVPFESNEVQQKDDGTANATSINAHEQGKKHEMKIERQAQWAERIERHEVNHTGKSGDSISTAGTPFVVKVAENTQRFGVEIEMKKWQYPVLSGMKDKLKKCEDIPDGKAAEWADKLKKSASNEGSMAHFYATKGYKAIYGGKGEWVNWNIHLDGGGRIIEMVTDPLDADGLAAKLEKLSTWLQKGGRNNAAPGKADIEKLINDGTHFTRSLPIGTSGDGLNNHMAYCFLETHFQFTRGGSESFQGTIAPKAAQLTTSLTAGQMCESVSVRSVISEKVSSWKNSPTCSSVTDDHIKEYLESFEFTGKEKPKDVLVKHVAEQLKDAIDERYDTSGGEAGQVTAGKIFDHKLDANHVPKWHGQANKIAKLMKRSDGTTAFMVEFRGESNNGRGIENKLYELFKDGATKEKFKKVIQKLEKVVQNVQEQEVTES